MLLNITYEGTNPADIGYVFYKNPSRPQSIDLNYGKAYVFYPEITESKATISLLLDINPIDLARGKEGTNSQGLFDYVNDRPYVSSSFLSTAISRVFGTAMTGRADDYQELSDSKLNLTATIVMLPCSGNVLMLNKVFEPLGYEVSYETFLSDENFPEWGESRYVNLTIKGTVRVRDLLKHIYVLIPVFDRQKHYWIGKEEIKKLLNHGEEWLKNHPAKDYIVTRYLNKNHTLLNKAFELLMTENIEITENEEQANILEKKESLNTTRINAVIDALNDLNASSVIDIGCGEGKLIKKLIRDSSFNKITGVDVSYTTLEKASRKLKLDTLSETIKNKINLFQGSLTYKDDRFLGYDVACVIEVIEHLDLNRLNAFEQVLFRHTKPKNVILTTPNFEYNNIYENLENGILRHADHRFEWTREEFKNWANKICVTYGYSVKISNIGDVDEKLGSPTQMGVFTLC